MIGKYFSKNSKLVPIEQATVPIDSIEFNYGFGVYENIKVRNKTLYFPEKHCERLLHSANYIGIKTSLTAKEIYNQIKGLTKSIQEESFNLKLMLMGKKESSDLYIMVLAPKYPGKKLYTQGVKVITVDGERQFPQAKTLSMLSSYLAYTKAKNEGCYDALLVHRNNEMVEGTRTNLFFTDGETIFTAPEKEVLNGVTRSTLIETLNKENIKVKEKTLKKEEIQNYKGFFLTSTSSKIVPISQIDNQEFEIPEIVKKTIKIYNNFLEEYKKTAERI